MNKKHVKILLSSVLSLSLLAACGNNETSEEDPSNDDDTEDVVETTDEEVEDKVVFDYLPEVTEEAKLIDSEEASGEEKGKAVYTIEDAKVEDVMAEYKEKLEDEGWEIVEDNSPELIRATKDGQEVIVAVGENEEDVTLTILSN